MPTELVDAIDAFIINDERGRSSVLRPYLSPTEQMKKGVTNHVFRPSEPIELWIGPRSIDFPTGGIMAQVNATPALDVAAAIESAALDKRPIIERLQEMLDEMDR